MEELNKRIEDLTAENRELRLLFEMQNKRCAEAIALWQKETGKKLSHPDYGVMISWLLHRAETAKEQMTLAEEAHTSYLEDFAKIKILIRANLMGDLSIYTMRKRAYKISAKHSQGIHLSMDEEGELTSEE